MNNYKQHQALLKKFKIAFQKKFPDGRCFDRHVGMFFTHSGSPVKIGKKGQADLWAIVNGQWYEFEIKSGKAVQTKEQKEWEKQVQKLGGKYFVVRESDLDLSFLNNS